ncbi:hypothetical protein CRG98_033904 [Punica granatum]|uniref:Protein DETOXIFICATION 27-like n=1 Tax=Punica granatum TaxID=22663 RepID=A0A2I0INK2_PUNGR|nr:hypothetical protein CRG98_033904 [Punica granatum]
MGRISKQKDIQRLISSVPSSSNQKPPPNTGQQTATVTGVDRDWEQPLGRRVWRETKKLWYILGPSIFSKVSNFTMIVIIQAFAGHVGEVELAAMSITITGFNYDFLLGMASALETLCGQAFGAKRYHMLGIYMQRSFVVLLLCCFLLLPVYVFAAPLLRLLGQPEDVAELTGELALWLIPVHFSLAFMFPVNRFLQSQLKSPRHCLGLPCCSMEAFSELREFVKLSIASGVMLCVSVANELGAGNGKAAKFATVVSVVQSTLIGLFFCVLVIA